MSVEGHQQAERSGLAQAAQRGCGVFIPENLQKLLRKPALVTLFVPRVGPDSFWAGCSHLVICTISLDPSVWRSALSGIQLVCGNNLKWAKHFSWQMLPGLEQKTVCFSICSMLDIWTQVSTYICETGFGLCLVWQQQHRCCLSSWCSHSAQTSSCLKTLLFCMQLVVRQFSSHLSPCLN